MSEEQLERLARYFDEEVIAAKNTNAPLELRFRGLLGEGGTYQVEAGGALKR